MTPADIAAAASHERTLRVLVLGPPGSGTTIFARHVREALAAPDDATALASQWLYYGSGLLDRHFHETPCVSFRAPHHTASLAALVGGGHPTIRPGETSLAHGGLLLLDEVTEFRLDVLAATGSVLAHGEVKISRGNQRVVYPARPRVLVCTANLCACGYTGSPRFTCSCSPERAARHEERMTAIAVLLGPWDFQINMAGRNEK